jgi:alpha-1,3-rhamnosyl/mannosyltransferase
MLYGRPDLTHRFDLRLPAAPNPEVVTVHDVPPLRFPDEGPLTRAAVVSARRARRVIVPSEFAASEARELLGVSEVTVIPYGVSEDYSGAAPATDAQLAALGITEPFFIHAAGSSLRKNLAGLADAWRQLLRDGVGAQLVLCGPGDVRRDAAFEGLDRVVKPGRLESTVVAALMRRASAVVIPSTYEGFGLPALEGMACGVPVVAARRGALPEVCGDAALLTEPDGEAMANALCRVLVDSALADSLRAAGRVRARQFDWDVAAREHLKVYQEALGS